MTGQRPSGKGFFVDEGRAGSHPERCEGNMTTKRFIIILLASALLAPTWAAGNKKGRHYITFSSKPFELKPDQKVPKLPKFRTWREAYAIAILDGLAMENITLMDNSYLLLHSAIPGQVMEFGNLQSWR